MTRIASMATSQLRALPVFAALSADLLGEVDRLLTRIDVPGGRVLCRQGSFASEAFIIASGVATVLVDDITVGYVGGGDMVGELALLGDQLRTASVVAESDLQVWVMNAGEFDALMAVPGVGDEVRRIATARTIAIG